MYGTNTWHKGRKVDSRFLGNLRSDPFKGHKKINLLKHALWISHWVRQTANQNYFVAKNVKLWSTRDQCTLRNMPRSLYFWSSELRTQR